MIELKNVSKAYRVSKEKPVAALKNISMVLPDAGMVFILGKSGSGKSTLLNVIGGIDGYDSGDLILFGKSSAGFKGKDFDSYRNKYVGFVFQDYNVLPGLTVRQNVGLALELQGDRADDGRIEKVLDEVGLKNEIDRKPGQLSGGQRQRVAIARALVKNPKVILGDEPTGALDSKSGEAVFKLLKKLSAARLVVCVTHDFRSAERYADRIITIKDGTVVSDLTKRGFRPQKVSPSGNVRKLTEGLLSINNPAELDSADVKSIANETAGKRGPFFIAYDGTERLPSEDQNTDETGNSAILGFSPTSDADIADHMVSGNEYVAQTSKVPVSVGMRMGASSLRHNPLRLAMSFVLSLIAFTFLGLSSTLSTYNESNTFAATADIYAAPYMAVKKNLYSSNGESVNDELRLSLSDASLIASKTGLPDIPVYSAPFATFTDSVIYTPYENFYSTSIMYAAPLSAASADGLGILAGSYPTAPFDIALTDYQFALLAESGVIFADGTQLGSDTALDFEQLQGKKIYITEQSRGLSPFTITGLVDTGIDIEEAREAVNSQITMSRETLSREVLIDDYFKNGPSAVALLSPAAFDNDSIKQGLLDIPDALNPLDRVLVRTKSKRDLASLFDFTSSKFSLDTSDGVYGAAYSEKRYGIYSVITSEYIDASFTSTLSRLSTVALYVAAAMAILSVLITMNYMFTSVAFKKQEIGILRGLGAKSLDVFGIFVWEAMFIATVNFSLSCVCTFLLSRALNSFLQASLQLTLPIIGFGWLQALVLFCVSFGVSIVSAVIPSYSIAAMKPVDAMKRGE